MSLPDLTLLTGPHTRLALAVNTAVRRQRGPLAAAGMGGGGVTGVAADVAAGKLDPLAAQAAAAGMPLW